jgi:hypothetical protein
MIVALDDDGVSLPSRGARDVSKPIPVNATKATDFVPVPKGAVVFFRGDHVHAGMCGTGVRARRASRMLERAARCLRSAVSTSINLR